MSNSLLGAGMWFWIILVSGLFVAVSAYIPELEMLGTFVARLLALGSIGAVLLGLVAVTADGSFV
jgi:vacuolar-type H+-ATPase subunit I/STV1